MRMHVSNKQGESLARRTNGLGVFLFCSAILLELLCFAFLHTLSDGMNLEGIALFFIIINSILYSYICIGNINDDGFVLIFLLAYLIRLILMLTDIYVVHIPYSGADTEGFFNEASGVTQIGLQGIDYYRFLFLLFKITGPVRLWAQYINLLASIGALFFLFKGLQLLGLKRKAVMIGACGFAFSPNWLCLSVILMREPLIVFFITFSLYFFLVWYVQGNFLFILAAIFATLPAMYLHSGMISIPLLYMVAIIFYNTHKRYIKIGAWSICLLLAAIICGVIILPRLGVSRFGDFSVDRIASYAIQYFNSGTESVGSMYLRGLVPDSLLDIILQTPLRTLYFLFSPLPWDWRGLQDMIAFTISGLPLLLILCYAFFSVCTSHKNRNLQLFLLITVIIFSVIFGWGTVAAGTAMRHKDKLVPIFMLLLALSIDAREKRNVSNAVPWKLTDTLSRYKIL